MEALEDRSLLAPFTPGNVVVYRVGALAPDNASLTANGSPVFLDEYTSNGTLVQSIAMPTSQDGLNRPLVASGVSASEGFLTRSADGRYLLLTGYDRALFPAATTTLQSRPATTVNRVIGRVDWLGQTNTSMGLGDFNGGIHTAASLDGSQVWVAGTQGTIQRASFGFSASTVIVSPNPSEARQLHIFNNQLYVSTGTKLAAVGSGLPASPAPLTGPPQFTLSSPHGFYFADLDPTVAGLDTLYVASDTTGLSKYSLYDGTWTLRGTVGTGADKYRGLTAAVLGETVTLYAVLAGGTNASGGGKLVKLVDESGYNGMLEGIPVDLKIAASQTAFRGVALAPFANNNAPVYDTSGNSALTAVTQVAINNAGNSIAELIASAGGDPITDRDDGALEGIAVIAADNSAGEWQYSLNGGADWNPLGSVSATSARMLAADGATRIRLVPNGTFTGILSDALRFRAWDRTEGVNGELLDPLPRRGADKTFSSLIESASIEVLVYTNTPPTISAISDQSVDEDESASVNFTVGDDGDLNALTVTAASSDDSLLPDSRIVLSGSGANRTVQFSPTPNLSGTVTISITVSDGEESKTEDFVLTIAPVNDPPTIAGLTERSTDEDTALPQIAITVADIDEPSGLTITVASDNPSLFPPANLVLSGTGTDRKLDATPALNQLGSALVTVTATDSSGASASQSFSVTVLAVNDPPMLSSIGNVTTTEDTAAPEVAFTIGDLETAVDDLQLAVASDNTALLPPQNLTIAGNGASRTLNLAPAFNESGTATITVTLTDGDGKTAIKTFTVTVTAVNDSPTISAIADAMTPEDTALTGIAYIVGDAETATADLNVSVASSDPLLFPPASFTITKNGAVHSLSMTPAENRAGAATITLSVADGDGTIATESFLVTVSPVNDPPTLSAIPDISGAEDTALADIPLVLGDLETTAESLSVAVESDNPTLFPAERLSIQGDGSSRTLRLSPAANQFGSALITVTVADTDGTTTRRTFVAQIAPTNDAPTISSLQNVAAAANAAIGPLLFTLGDIDNDSSLLTVIAGSSNLAIAPLDRISFAGSGSNRTVTIVPMMNEAGSAMITLTVSDGQGGQAVETFEIVVAENIPPTLSEIADQSLTEDESLGNIPLAIGDPETSVDELTVSTTTSNPGLFPPGSLLIEGVGEDRRLRITPTANASGSAVITVNVADENGATSSRSFNVAVAALNDAPVAAHSQLSVSRDTPEQSSLLATDVDSPDLIYRLASLPRKGIVTITDSATGAYTYRPYAEQYGPDRFTFQASDGLAVSTATIAVDVQPFVGQAALVDGVLTVTGTPDDDYIVVARATDTEVVAVVGIQVFGPFPEPTMIRLHGGAGDDYLLVHNLTIPAELNQDAGAAPSGASFLSLLSPPSSNQPAPDGEQAGSPATADSVSQAAPSRFGHILVLQPRANQGVGRFHSLSEAASATVENYGRLIDLALHELMLEHSMGSPLGMTDAQKYGITTQAKHDEARPSERDLDLLFADFRVSRL